MSLSKPIQYIIDSHSQHQNVGEARSTYWSDLVTSRGKQVHHHEDHEARHHIGDYYARFGMKINPFADDPKSRELITVMNAIEESLKSVKKTASINKFIEAFDDMFEKNSEWKSVSSVKSPQHILIQALAASILAETNGNSQTAKKILENGGMKEIINLTPQSLDKLMGKLVDILSEPSLENPSKEHNR